MNVDVPELLRRLNVDVTSEGVETWAHCPFPDHEDSTPSFHVRDEPGDEKHGWWACLGCSRKGGALGLVMGLLNLDEEQAFAWIRSSGLATPQVEGFGSVKSDNLYKGGFRMPPEIERKDLQFWPGPARSYAMSRGLTPEQIERWDIGYAVAGRLKHRIVIPKYTSGGALAGYTARSYLSRSERKYLEPDADEHADPNVVFGERHWPDERRRQHVVVCEGAFDALACERAVLGPVAAISGGKGKLSQEHLRKIGTFPYVVALTDPDDAGDAVAEALKATGSIVYRLSLPGLDACAFGLREPQVLEHLINHAIRALYGPLAKPRG